MGNNPTQKPAISVLLSVYNGERFLKEAVESILNQTYSDFEFIIINDASTDKTFNILSDFANKDSRIRVVHNETNIGLTKSLNRGLAVAQATYVARMDADDVSLLYRLQEQFSYMESHPDVALVGSSATLINKDGQQIGKALMTSDPILIRYSSILGKPSFVHSSWFFRTDIVKKEGGYNESFKNAQDFELVSRLMEKYQVTNIDSILVLLRIHDTSVTTNLRTEEDFEKIFGLRVFLKNICRYTDVSKNNFFILYESKTRGVRNTHDLFTALKTIRKIQRAFIAKENPETITRKKLAESYRKTVRTIIIKFLRRNK